MQGRMRDMKNTLVTSLIEAEEKAYPRSDRITKALWPILNNKQKQEYWYRKHNWIICGDVDEFLNDNSFT